MLSQASSYAALNRPADALKLFEETLAIQKRVLPQDHPSTLMSMVNLADSLIRLDRGAEAIPFLDEFLTKARTSPTVDRRLIPMAVSLRMGHFQKTGDPAGCRATAEMWEKLNRPDAASLYDAACWRAVTAAVQAKTSGAEAARLATEDADRAMAWLTKAIAAGYKDRANMEKDNDLDALRCPLRRLRVPPGLVLPDQPDRRSRDTQQQHGHDDPRRPLHRAPPLDLLRRPHFRCQLVLLRLLRPFVRCASQLAHGCRHFVRCCGPVGWLER